MHHGVLVENKIQKENLWCFSSRAPWCSSQIKHHGVLVEVALYATEYKKASLHNKFAKT
jgi:hypothetical protein